MWIQARIIQHFPLVFAVPQLYNKNIRSKEVRPVDRSILHCDCNSFYASVEALHRPSLRDKPLAVGGDVEQRHGIILAKNDIAKRYQIKTGEALWQARQKCPDLVIVPPNYPLYLRYSKLCREIFMEYTPQVEPFGIDEAWLDVTGSTGIFGGGPQIAEEIRRRIRYELGITVSIGVSFNKIFAKLGSDYKKPDATTVISRENFRRIVWPLPVGALLYVGKAAQETLAQLQVRTVGQLAASDRALVAKRLGKMGEMIHDYANGLDESPVRAADDTREIKSVGNGMTYRRNLVGLEDIRLAVLTLSDSVSARMRRHGVKCRTVQVLIRDPGFKSISRQRALPAPTHLGREIAEAALAIIRDAWDLRAPIRMITITGANLTDSGGAGEQLSLFAPPDDKSREKRERLEAAMDGIREKFGQDAIGPAGVLGNDIGIGGAGWNKDE